jgi:hypothetical protein
MHRVFTTFAVPVLRLQLAQVYFLSLPQKKLRIVKNFSASKSLIYQKCIIFAGEIFIAQNK